MPPLAKKPPIRIAIVGAGAVSDYHHVPGIRLDPRAELVAVCDADPALCERRKSDWGVTKTSTDAVALCADPDIDAMIIATPNFTAVIPIPLVVFDCFNLAEVNTMDVFNICYKI